MQQPSAHVYAAATALRRHRDGVFRLGGYVVDVEGLQTDPACLFDEPNRLRALVENLNLLIAAALTVVEG